MKKNSILSPFGHFFLSVCPCQLLHPDTGFFYEDVRTSTHIKRSPAAIDGGATFVSAEACGTEWSRTWPLPINTTEVVHPWSELIGGLCLLSNEAAQKKPFKNRLIKIQPTGKYDTGPMERLRLVIYDRTCKGPGPGPGLSHGWFLGSALYRLTGRIDRFRAVSGWREALEWLASFAPGLEIQEVQFWGHGKWGCALIGREPLDETALEPGHPLHAPLHRIRDRMSHDSLWWFRTCETFGAAPGHRFAKAWANFFGCRAAGHTYVIGPLQSGLHTLMPGEEPDWPLEEGLRRGTDVRRPTGQALISAPWSPNTITCLETSIPERY